MSMRPLPGEAPRALAFAPGAGQGAGRSTAAPRSGGDRVRPGLADLTGEPLGKPGQHERAVQQLRQMRGQTVVFQTALAVARRHRP